MSFCAEPDYRQLYLDMQVPTFSYIHGIDPGQYYDNKHLHGRLILFQTQFNALFQNNCHPPSYYLLTPTTFKGGDYVLFKENGVVKYTIPVYKKEFVPEGFYDSHIQSLNLQKHKGCKRLSLPLSGNTLKERKRNLLLKLI